MKCPSCGAEIGNSRVCSYCGSQITIEMLRNQETLNMLGCPNCGSTNIQIRRENQGEYRTKRGKAIIHRTVAFCKNCGCTWEPSNNGISETRVGQRRTWLWVLGWLFIFPLPLTIILLKKDNIKPAVKYGIIIAAWILYASLVFYKKANSNPKNPNSSNGIVAMHSSEPYATQQAETTPEIPSLPFTAQYTLTGEVLGSYGRRIVLNQNTDMPVEKYLYKLPVGKYLVTTNSYKAAAFSIVKDNTVIDESNPNYPENLQYVGQGQYVLTAGEIEQGGLLQRYVIVELNADESFQLVGNETFYFKKIGS